MSYQNISYVVSEADAAAIRNSIATLNTLMPFLVNLTPEERKRMLKHGDSNTEFVSDGVYATIHHPEIFPQTFEVPEYHRDNNLYNFLDEIHQRLQSVQEKVKYTKMAVGNELMTATNRVYDIVNREKNSTPGIQSLYQKMRNRYKKQGPKKGDTSQEGK